MANKNKNINELVADENDRTTELKILAWDLHAVREDSDLESDADTFDYIDSTRTESAGDETISELKSDLQNRSETIDRLQYDIEQLRAKWAGVESEITARQEITERLNHDLKNASEKRGQINRKLKTRDKTVKSLKAEIKSLKAEVRKRDGDFQNIQETATELETRISQGETTEEQLRSSLESSLEESARIESELRELQEELKSAKNIDERSQREIAAVRQTLAEAQQATAELQQYVDGRRADWDAMCAKLAEQDELADQSREKHESSLADLSQRRDEANKLGSIITARDMTIRQLSDDIGALQDELDTHNSDDGENIRRTLSEQAGQLSSSAMTIKELRAQIDRTESYADTIRHQLHDLISQSNAANDKREELQLSLDNSITLNTESQDALALEKQVVVDLKQELQEAIDSHVVEVRTIRFELGEAEDSLAQNELVSEQLVSDLVDTREFKNDLETRLSERDEESQRKIDELTEKNRKLERSVADYEQKLETESESVKCLFAELAKKDQQMESIDQIEGVNPDIDDRMSERIDNRPTGERDRVTRVLIGSIDGKELRFPLFKKRLTIGRTRKNDIQLDADYISRQHAAIVTEGNATRIVDWGSKNGVSVNSKRITEHFLKNGDVIKIGTADFRYEERPKRDTRAGP
jgi:chromosome segregation ATPase